MPADPRQIFGRRAEQLAARELRRRGYRILARNWRCRIGEVDLIAEHDGDLVFVEVKARASSDFGGPELAVNATKQRKLSRLLDVWLLEHAVGEVNARFDIVALVFDERGRVATCEVFQNAFPHVG